MQTEAREQTREEWLAGLKAGDTVRLTYVLRDWPAGTLLRVERKENYHSKEVTPVSNPNDPGLRRFALPSQIEKVSAQVVGIEEVQ